MLNNNMSRSLICAGFTLLVVTSGAYAQTSTPPATTSIPSTGAAPSDQPATPNINPTVPQTAVSQAPAALMKGVLIMDKAAQEQMVEKLHPNSLTGTFSSVTFPIGVKLRDAALSYFKLVFPDGFEVSEAAKSGVYSLSVRSDGFAYKYDQLSNLGMAITPRVSFGVTIELFDATGKSLMRKSYNRVDYANGAYVLTFHPKERVYATYEAGLKDAFGDANKDITAAILANNDPNASAKPNDNSATVSTTPTAASIVPTPVAPAAAQATPVSPAVPAIPEAPKADAPKN